MKILQAIITIVYLIVVALFVFDKLDTAPYDKKLVITLITAVYGAIIFFLNMKKKTIDWEALAEIRQNDQELIAFQRKTIEELKQQIKRKNQSKWEKEANKLLAKGKLQEAIESIDTNTTDEEAAQKHIRKAQLLIVAYNFTEAEAHYKQAAAIFPSPENNFTAASFFQDLNRFKEAEDYYTRCLNQVTSSEERANVLNNLGIVQWKLNDYAQAEASYTEALKTYKDLAATNPQAYLPDVAMTLNNLGALQYNTNAYAQAEAFYTEALKIRRELAKKNPQAYLPDVAITLNNLGNLQADNKYYPQAEASLTEALKIRKELVAKNPQAYLPYVASTLVNLSLFYKDNTPNKAKSLQYAKEAIKVLKRCNDTPWVQEALGKARRIIDNWKGEN